MPLVEVRYRPRELTEHQFAEVEGAVPIADLGLHQQRVRAELEQLALAGTRDTASEAGRPPSGGGGCWSKSPRPRRYSAKPQPGAWKFRNRSSRRRVVVEAVHDSRAAP